MGATLERVPLAIVPQPTEFARQLAAVYDAKLPVTVEEILYTHEDGTMAVTFRFADGDSAAVLIPAHMLSLHHVRVSAAAATVLWELLEIMARQTEPRPLNVRRARTRRSRVSSSTDDRLATMRSTRLTANR